MDIETINDPQENQSPKGLRLNKYIKREKLSYGKKFYVAEFFSEKIIQIIAITSIAIILAIFYYVFHESVYAFINLSKKTEQIKSDVATNQADQNQTLKENATNDKQTASDKLKPDTYSTDNTESNLKPEQYSSSPSAEQESLKPEKYSPGNEKSNTAKIVDASTDNAELKPEKYSPGSGNQAELKPETYGTATDTKTQNDTKKQTQPAQTLSDTAPDTTENDTAQTNPSINVESTGNNQVVDITELILPNDRINNQNAFIWQPISQTPKYSFVPLALGALKVSLLGLLIAAPIAILAAIFTTAFAPRWMKEIMKPAIEILAGFPSVVIGFFCLITLATVVQQLFGNSFRLNSFVGALGMALAVIPIVFTVTEDALSAVPNFMKEASLALGGSRWQTAFRVTLPAALPGVFAAIILGFGRAFGETMIALMATGNAAITTAGLFDSVRTMAATIGAEMAEVEFHSVHYGILFLIGALLFVVTFSLNALAEFWVRNKLLKKFQGR